MVQKHSVEGMEAFKSKVEALAKEEIPLFVYFSGSKTSDGEELTYGKLPYFALFQAIFGQF